MKTMLALVKEKREKGLVMKEVPIPKIGINDVKIKIKKTAICGTDLHIYDWNDWAKETIKTPMIIGHEYVGEIVEMGSNVKGFKIGQRVTGEGHLVCGQCRNCKAGNGHLCKFTQGVGVNRNGAFAEYLVIPQTNVFPCSDNISDELYSIFDPFGNATHTALSFNVVGEDVIVTGAGPIGIMAGGIAKYCGARNVVITDYNDYRLELAKKFGITRTVNPSRENLQDIMKELNIKEGFDVGMEMSGNSNALHQLISVMENGGNIALLGLQNKNSVEIPLNTIIWNGLKLKGIYGRELGETWYKMQAMIQGGFNLEPIITHRFNVKDFEKGFEVMSSGKCGKVILEWENL